jgi:AcrR family transcriptional regulator
MPPDASATKARLLQAATEEFTAYGMAGARVDRIAARAGANKRLIYVHFGTKEELFDIVVQRQLGVLADAVPFTPADLPGYAGALFDWVAAHPEALRLNAWKQLERPRAAAAEMDIYRPKLAALAALPGPLAGADPADVLALVIGLATAWFTASPALRELAAEAPWSPERLAAHRAAVMAAAASLTHPQPAAAPR